MVDLEDTLTGFGDALERRDRIGCECCAFCAPELPCESSQLGGECDRICFCDADALSEAETSAAERGEEPDNLQVDIDAAHEAKTFTLSGLRAMRQGRWSEAVADLSQAQQFAEMRAGVRHV
ncbi:MAG: hypothetical protein K0V04_20055 [Deltaproteobacteria bacterium]|nr:hypothetical protein [Deltaproteobacteria bacterium]